MTETIAYIKESLRDLYPSSEVSSLVRLIMERVCNIQPHHFLFCKDKELPESEKSRIHDNDPKMIFIYGEIDPWSAAMVPAFKGKKNEQIYIQPRGSHRARIGNMPEDMKERILTQMNKWLAE